MYHLKRFRYRYEIFQNKLLIEVIFSDTELIDESYSLYGVKIPPAGPRAAPRTQFAPASVPYDATR